MSSRLWGERKCGGHRRAKHPDLPCFAAIDLGTHNCRMLIAQPSNEGPAVIDGFSRMVRLGEGLTKSEKLCENAIYRTIGALKVCAKKISKHNVVKARHVATEACRLARNRSDFFDRVHDETGIRLEAIPPEEEADLTLTGCLPLLKDGPSRALLFDIGGGSTELNWVDLTGALPRTIAMTSLPVGVVNLMEKNGCPDCTKEGFRCLVGEIDYMLQPFDDANGISNHFNQEGALLLGTSGTVTTLGALHLNLPRYDRSQVDGLVLDFSVIEDMAAEVSSMSWEQRRDLPCVGPERADLMVMGCAILTAITERWRSDRIRIADRGVREGLLVQMMQEHPAV
ncbi:MAG: Ppx/GppA phosphatase family protein [Rhodospirillaceae bacterium]